MPMWEVTVTKEQAIRRVAQVAMADLMGTSEPPPGEMTQPYSYTQVDKDITVCNDCGAYAETEQAVQHHSTCKPGESKEWRKFFECP